jgi:hypothetical protein
MGRLASARRLEGKRAIVTGGAGGLGAASFAGSILHPDGGMTSATGGG